MVPGGWRKIKWGDAATLEYGKSLNDYKEKEGKIPVFGTNGSIGYTDKPLCQFPSVIIGRKGAYRGIHYSKSPFFVIDTAFYLKPIFEDLDLKFAYYQLLTKNINEMDSGSAIPSTSRKDFYNLDLLLPDLISQQTIVTILSSLDDKIELNQQMNKTLEAIAQAIFKEWFVDFKFPGFDGELVEGLPNEWSRIKLGDIISFVKGKKPKGTSDVKKENYLPQLLIDTFNSGNFVFADATNMVIANEHDMLMVMDGASSGRIEIGFSGIVGSTLAKIKVADKFNHPLFIFHFLKTKVLDITSNTTGSSIPHADKSKIFEYIINLPSKYNLQKFEEIAKCINDYIVLNKKENQTLAHLRNNLLPKLMTGKIKVA